MSEKAFIECGSNIQPEIYLPKALAELRSVGKLLAVSKAYQNPAIANEPQPDYINACALVATKLSPFDLRARLRGIESELDRVRSADKFAPRTIDLDIALYGAMILEHPLLKVPDNHIYERPHLAITLAECDPDFVHPQTGETLETIAERLKESGLLTPRDDIDLSSALDRAQG